MNKRIAFVLPLFVLNACLGTRVPMRAVESKEEAIIVAHVALTKAGDIKDVPAGKQDSLFLKFDKVLMTKQYRPVVWDVFHAKYPKIEVMYNHLNLEPEDESKQKIGSLWLFYHLRWQYAKPSVP